MRSAGEKRIPSAWRLFGGLLVLALLLRAPVPAQTRFLDPDGRPLPFATFEEVEEFLRTADIVWMKKIKSGTNRQKRKVLLRHGELSAHAVLRRVFEIRNTPGGGFVDSYLSDLAAYELSRVLGLDNVPPVVRRKGGGLQIWIEQATTEAGRLRAGTPPADPVAHERQLMDMHVFDNLIANTDRNPGNVVVATDGRLWLIDQTRSFAGQRVVKYPERIAGCSRKLWERLRAVTRAEIRQSVGPYPEVQLEALFERRELLIAVIAARIAADEEGAFLF